MASLAFEHFQGDGQTQALCLHNAENWEGIFMKLRLALLPAALIAANAYAADTADYTEQFAKAFEQDMGLARAEIPRYANAEKHAFRVESQAVEFLGDSFAGSWFERNKDGSYSHIVAATKATDVMANASAEIRVVDYSMAELNATMDTLNDHLAELYAEQPAGGLDRAAAGLGDVAGMGLPTLSFNKAQGDAIQSMYVDVKTNSVVVHVDADAMAAGIDFLALSDVEIGAIRIESSTGQPELLANIWGGRAYTSGGGRCSVGFAVRRGSQNGFVTAGHCGGRGTRVSVDGENTGSVQGASFPGDDMAWASARSSDRLWGAVDFYNGGTVLDYNVRGSNVAAIGAVVCRSGSTTGARCGNIQSRNATVNYGTGPVRGLTQATACAGRGDSGGSWVSAGNQAQGVTSGGQLTNGNDNCGASVPRTWFQPVNEILNTYNLRLVTR